MSEHRNRYTPSETVLDGHYIATASGFCRKNTASVGRLILHATEIRERQGLAPDDPWQIIQAGCSHGEETWSMAAGLAQQRIPFQIQAYDINPSVLRVARRRYPYTKADLAIRFASWGLPAECANFFNQVSATQSRAQKSLQRAVTFERADIRTDWLAPGHVLVVNNVLSYYLERPELPDIIGNLASSLETEGLFVTNNSQTIIRECLADNDIWPDKNLYTGGMPEIFRHRPIQGTN